MKNLVLLILTFFSFVVYGQKNVFHQTAFWKDVPNIDKVKKAISEGFSPLDTNEFGFDGVIYALNASASNEVIKFLLEQHGARPDKPLAYGRTYMFYAASKGNVEIMEFLKSKGARANIKDNFGYSVLTYAASGGQSDTRVYDLCIKDGTDPRNEKVRGGNSLHLIAPYAKDFYLINYFINNGIDVKSVDSLGNTVFDHALRYGNIPVLKELASRGVKYSRSAMVIAAQGARNHANPIELYQYLEELKLDPMALSSNGDNALHFVVRRPQQEEIIKYFLDKGLDVNHANQDGTTPFMNAASVNSDSNTLKMLFPYLRNINHRNKKGISALMLAVRRNTPEIVKLLIDNGAEVNIADSEGFNIAFYLVPNYNAQRPENFDKKLELLEKNGFNIALAQPNGNSLYHLVLVRHGIELLKRIAVYNVDVNAKNKEGLTPLHKASLIAKDDAVLKYLLSIGASKLAKTEFGETAYDLASENEYLKKQHISADFLK